MDPEPNSQGTIQVIPNLNLANVMLFLSLLNIPPPFNLYGLIAGFLKQLFFLELKFKMYNF